MGRKSKLGIQAKDLTDYNRQYYHLKIKQKKLWKLDKYRQRWKNYYYKNRERLLQNSREYYKQNHDRMKKSTTQSLRNRRIQLRMKIILHYTDGKLKCNCCGSKFPNFIFLTIDHVNNDGNDERKKFKKKGEMAYYKSIIDRNYPDDYQILCWNCNMAKVRNNGVCPCKISNPYIILK